MRRQCAFRLLQREARDAEKDVYKRQSVFYVLLGWYLRAFDVSIRIMVPLGIACLVAVVVVAGGGVVMTGGYQRWSWEPASPFIAIWATALFVAAKRFVDRPLRKGGVFETLASLSFAVYLLHPRCV